MHGLWQLKNSFRIRQVNWAESIENDILFIKPK